MTASNVLARLESGSVHTNNKCYPSTFDGSHEHPVIEDGTELAVGKGQGPEAQVAGGVAHSAQHKLDGMDHLQYAALDHCRAVRLHIIAVAFMFSDRNCGSLLACSNTYMNASRHALML